MKSWHILGMYVFSLMVVTLFFIITIMLHEVMTDTNTIAEVLYNSEVLSEEQYLDLIQ